MIATADAFEAAVRARLTLDAPRLAGDPARGPGDHLLDPGQHEAAEVINPKPAAVLIPVVQRAEAAIILTQRSARLSNHAGQIAFPGGKIDAGDAGPAAAALREAEEEIGLARDHVEPLGYAAPYHTGSGFRILPVIGLVRPGFALAPNPGEVADVFEVPLGFLMDPANHRIGFRQGTHGRRFFYEIPWGERYIWGVTAGIVRRIYERMFL
jgi:8-oxo-dGTP pyrophosphatase MutT (NUDIX family)